MTRRHWLSATGRGTGKLRETPTSTQFQEHSTGRAGIITERNPTGPENVECNEYPH